MDNVDDLLLSGLDQDSLPHVEPQQVNLNGLNVKYEYKNVEFLFLTREYEELEQFVDDCELGHARVGAYGIVRRVRASGDIVRFT